MKYATFAAIAAITLAGCASITDGTSQTIIFKLDPEAARCVASRDGSELGSVGGKINTLTVGKGAKDILITCTADGYMQKTQRLISSTQAAGVIGGAFLDLGIVDMMTGAMWKYPSEVNVIMEKSGGQVAPAAASSSPAAVPTASR